MSARRRFSLFLIAFLGIIALHVQESEGAQLVIERIKPAADSWYLFKGDSIKILCKVTSVDKQIENMEWLYRGIVDVSIKNKTDFQIINKWNSNKTAVQSLLTVLNVPTTNSVLYRCKADIKDSQPADRSIEYNYIHEKSIPKVDITDSKISEKSATANGTAEGKYNSSAVLNCKLTFERNDKLSEEYVSVRLRKNSAILAEKPNVKYEKAANLTLEYRISNVDIEDGGVYICSSKTVLGHRIFITSQYIKLTLPLRLTGAKEKEIRSSPGNDVELICEIEGFPTPKWNFQHGKYKDVSNNSDITVHGNRLQIQEVEKHHQGLYICIAADQTGNTKTQNIFLKITDNDKNKAAKKHSSLLVIVTCFIFTTFASLVLQQF